MKMREPRWLYTALWGILRVSMSIWHPFTHIQGRDRIPADACMMVANHSSMADPIWVLLALGPQRSTYIMAKKQLMDVPLLSGLLRWVGVFAVDRGNADIGAIKKALEVLKNGEKLLIFPEGTRVKTGKQVEAKTGAVMLANRTAVPVVPIYISQKKRPFLPIRVIVGEPFHVTSASRRQTSAELEESTAAMMQIIYRLESGE